MLAIFYFSYPPHWLKVKVARLLIQDYPSLKSSLKNAEGHVISLLLYINIIHNDYALVEILTNS